MLLSYSNFFSILQRGGGRHLGFSKIQNFNRLYAMRHRAKFRQNL